MGIAVLLSLALALRQSTAAKWDYDEAGYNVSHWADGWEECGGSRQSPIDIPASTIAECAAPSTNAEDTIPNNLMSLDWQSEKVHFGIRNNGHSIQAIPLQIDVGAGSDFSGLEVLHHTNDTRIRLKNLFYDTYASRVNKEYCFDSLHFHWGVDDNSGSEHTIDGNMYPLEVHLVHYSCDYQTLNDAVTAYMHGATDSHDDENILAVIGVLFEIGEENPVIDRILSDNILDAIHLYHNPEHEDATDTDDVLSVWYTEFDVNDLLPTNREFYGYEGSLTTPPCLETVRWHVMRDTISLSAEQMEKFRLVSEADLDSQAPNFRPVQALNGRTIYHCEEGVTAKSVEKEALPIEELEDEPVDDVEEIVLWRSIGVVFMCAFIFSCAVIICLLYRFRDDRVVDVKRRKSNGADYKRTSNASEFSPVNTRMNDEERRASRTLNDFDDE